MEYIVESNPKDKNPLLSTAGTRRVCNPHKDVAYVNCLVLRSRPRHMSGDTDNMQHYI